MGELLLETPVNWNSIRRCTTPGILEELKRRTGRKSLQDVYGSLPVFRYYTRGAQEDLWCDEIHCVRSLRQQGTHVTCEARDILGRILCQAVEVPRDCERELLPGQNHNLVFFTNYRTIQIYCPHSIIEKKSVLNLISKDFEFRFCEVNNKLYEETYDQCTQVLFYRANSCLAWECIFPEGIDMEALSPRDANAHIRVKQQAAKSKPQAPTAKLPQKEKDHPPPPPEEVREPPSSDRRDGAIYKTGRLLGRGGFAICYEGQLVGTKQKYALKIVKSHMPQKKMEQKFQTELQIHSKMKHANIVQFHRAFSYEKCTYIVLELCPNGSLMDMVKKRKYITEPEVRFWTVQMAGAIKYMHSKGIIHRDLKMGNIFLDKNMNVKIGDFGLAALLMSGKDWTACRRTTLCGTPNYIAPEILSKDKSGHDHAVDIWSLGIIIFAMLTGKPPFQSATADEIYRRAREREYDWPKLDTSENFISDETKDLVSALLQAPEKRPDPDTIVQHPFFICGWLPQSEEMTPSLREKHPDPSQFLSVGVRAGRSNLYLRNLKKLCIKCEVGPWNPSPKHHTSTYREVEAEEKAGRTPAVPLPEDIVYRPFDEWLKEQAENAKERADEALSAVEALEKILSPVPASRSENLPSSSRATQSFAAQQRGRPPSTVSSTSRIVKTRQPAKESARDLLTIPSRHSKPRLVENQVSEEVADVEDRLAADLVNHLNPASAKRESQETDAPMISLPISASLFNPRERVELLPNTGQEHVLEGLRRLQTELERALNSRSIAIESKSRPPHPSFVVKWVDYSNKFGLGYTLNNGSVGCVFRALPVDSLDTSKGYVPPTCMVIRDADRHIKNKTNESYVDRHQIVPISGPNIEFYENRGEKGVSRGKVNPQNYKIQVGVNGEVGQLDRGVDEWDDRKRERIILWKKFSNYMVEFGKDQNYPHDEALTRTPPERQQSETTAPGNVVTFHQRWGDVGCWGFADGHLQFNFPDHTKIVLSADGTWCNFYHLPLEAARDLSLKGTLSSAALDDRQHLSYPLQTLLNFMVKPSRTGRTTNRKRPEIDPMIQGIPQANEFRKKMEFIRLVVKEWVNNGGRGISDMTPRGRLRWDGNRELINVKVPYKHVWVTVGGRNGDDRRVAWFNPRKPREVIPDIQ